MCDKLSNSNAFNVILAVPRARVPVLKVKHAATGIQCDISTTNGLGVENSKLLRSVQTHIIYFKSSVSYGNYLFVLVFEMFLDRSSHRMSKK